MTKEHVDEIMKHFEDERNRILEKLCDPNEDPSTWNTEDRAELKWILKEFEDGIKS